MTEETQCWSCGETIAKEMKECPNCGVSIAKKSTNDDMDFLDDLLSTTSSDSPSVVEPKDSDEEFDFVIPDMEYVSGATDETSSPKGEFDEGYGEVEEDPFDFSIPDMEYVSGATDVTTTPKGEFDNQTKVESPSISETDKASMLADMDSLFEDMEQDPSTSTQSQEMDMELNLSADIDALLDQTPSDKEEITEETKSVSIKKTKIVWLFTSQIFYWTTVYIFIVFASFEVINPNFNPYAISATDFTISPFGFLIAWGSFFAMGWFFSYKLRSYNIVPRIYHAVVFLILYSISIFTTSIFLNYLYNPTQSPLNYVLTGYLLLIPQHFLATFLTAGWFSFALGYKYLWMQVFKLSPQHEMNPALADM